MAYTTPERVRATLISTGGATPATDDKATPASMTDEQLQIAVEDADGTVDGYLAARYSTPFAETPALIRALSTAVAAYLATLTFRKTQNLEERDPAQLRYSWARRTLEDIRDGRIDVPGADTDAEGAEVLNPYCGDLWAVGDFDTREVPRRHGWM